MCKWFATLFGLGNDASVKKQLEILRKDIFSQNEERLLVEKHKHAEQNRLIDMLRNRLSDIERREIQSK